MKKQAIQLDTDLRGENIDRCADLISEYLSACKTEKREVLRLRLLAEEILLNWQSRLGETQTVTLSCKSRMGQPTLQLTAPGDPCDPLEQEDGTDWSRRLLSDLQTTPVYKYQGGQNTVLFRLVRKPTNPLIPLLISLALAVVTVLAAGVLPNELRVTVVEKLLTPLCDTYLKVINFFGIPLIFLTAFLGICGIRDTDTFGRIGKRLTGYYVGFLAIVATAATLVALLFFPQRFGAIGSGLHLKSLYEMVLGFLPVDLFTPFISCNAIQMVLLGILMGIAVLKLAPATDGFVSAMDGLDRILVQFSLWYAKLIPFFTYFIVVKGLWVEGFGAFLSIWKPWVTVIGLQALALLLCFVQVRIKHKAKISSVIQKVSRSFVVALGTNSCCATIPEMFDCSARLGVDDAVMNLGIPVGTTLFKPATAIRFAVVSLFMASHYSQNISLGWVIMAVLMSILLSIAAPAIPGGVLLFYPLLFSQLGIPNEAMSLLMATDIFFDALCTGFNQVHAEIAMVHQSGRLGLLDEKKLKE